MKKIYTIIILTLVTLTAAAQSTKELWVFHTNDTHSRIEPLSKNNPDPAIAGKAGYMRRATFINEQRKKHPDMLLFDSGDVCQGTPYFNLFKGELEYKLMDQIGYDAVTIGNHEFDFGMDNLARLYKLIHFPVVCCNYDVTGTVLEGLVKPWIVIKKKGLKIGVFGVSPELDGLVQKKNCEGVTFMDPSECAQKTADHLRNEENCDIVICLSHLGWHEMKYCDVKLIAETRGIDAVIGGHSHSYFNKPAFYKNLDGKEIPVSQMGKHGAYVGWMKFTLEEEK